MVNFQSIFDGFGIVVGTACLLAAANHAHHKLVLGHLKSDYVMQFLAAALEKRFSASA